MKIWIRISQFNRKEFLYSNSVAVDVITFKRKSLPFDLQVVYGVFVILCPNFWPEMNNIICDVLAFSESGEGTVCLLLVSDWKYIIKIFVFHQTCNINIQYLHNPMLKREKVVFKNKKIIICCVFCSLHQAHPLWTAICAYITFFPTLLSTL